MGKNLKSYLVTIVGAEKILQKVPEGTHDYEKYIDYVELSQMLLKLNEPSFTQVSLTDESKVSSVKQLKIQAVEGMFYNLITQRWSFSDDRDVNYILHAKFH